jgi:DNA-binding CsgD family transcriptional regulator
VSATAAGTTVERGDVGRSIAFEHSAELVDISERIYRGVFAVGLWVAVGCTAFGVLASLLQPPGSQLRGVMVCGACLAAVIVAATHAGTLYRELRRSPWILLVFGAILGVGAFVVGPRNVQFFVPIAAIIGVLGTATPLRAVAAAGVLAAVGFGAPQIIYGRSDVGAAIAVIVPPIMFSLIVDRIAGYALRLNQTLANVTTATPPSSRVTLEHDDNPADPSSPHPGSRGRESQRGLPEPLVIEVDGTRLTSRQLQVVLLACEGLKHGEIGACLAIRAQQVRRHLDQARQRTGSDSTPQLIAWARRTGLVPRPTRDGSM